MGNGHLDVSAYDDNPMNSSGVPQDSGVRDEHDARQ